MKLDAIALVGLSACLHALWNYLAKRAQDQISFMFLMMATSPLIWLGPLLWMLWRGVHFGPLYLPIMGGLFQALYCYLMGRGYACGDLSQVYPLARGLAPVLIAVLGWLILGERLTIIGAVGIGFVVLGSLVLNASHWHDLINGNSLRALCQPAARVALLASVTIAAYHLIDKAGALRADTPFAYLAFMHFWLIIFLTVFTLKVRTPQQIKAEWRRNWPTVLLVMFFCFAAYFLVVTAMTLSQVAYVASLRNLSILLSVGLGAVALKEKNVLWRALGAALMIGGIVAIAAYG